LNKIIISKKFSTKKIFHCCIIHLSPFVTNCKNLRIFNKLLNFIDFICYCSSVERTIGTVRLKDEITYKLLKLIEDEPNLSQREIAQKMGVSLGKTNYCLKALIDKGFIKLQNFYKNKKKSAYIYFLTPRGIEEKAAVTYRFLHKKLKEYESIKQEIESLKVEADELKDIEMKDSDF